MTTNVLLVVVGVVVFLAAEAAYYLVVYRGEQRRHELRRRLKSLGMQTAGASLLRERRMARSPSLDALLRPWPFAQRLEELLLKTDLNWTVAFTLALCIGLAVGLTMLLVMPLHSVILSALVGIPLGGAIPILIVLNARVRRSIKISQQLPDALEMMVRSLRAGHGISSGFKLVAEEMPAPVAVEFGRCFEEQNFGVDFREAITHMTERVPDNLDLKLFAVSVIIQRETGGNLVEILDQIATTIRDRFRFYGKLRALTAEGRLSGYILGALPFLCLLFVGLMNPQYLVPMVTDTIGRLMALGGLVMWALGILWMRKLSQVDY